MPDQDDLTIPEFLKRKPGGRVPAKSEVVMVKSDDVDTVEDSGADEAPAPAKARKVKAKANGAAKPAVKAAKAPKKAAAKVAAKAPRKAKPATPRDAYGFGEGTLKSRAAAMYAHKKGATVGEVKAALGAIQFNLLKQLEGQGYKVTRTKEAGEGNKKITRYKLSK